MKNLRINIMDDERRYDVPLFISFGMFLTRLFQQTGYLEVNLRKLCWT